MESCQLDLIMKKKIDVDVRRLGQYADKSRSDVFIIRNEWKIGKAEWSARLDLKIIL